MLVQELPASESDKAEQHVPRSGRLLSYPFPKDKSAFRERFLVELNPCIGTPVPIKNREEVLLHTD
jgi:hypothetical protein